MLTSASLNNLQAQCPALVPYNQPAERTKLGLAKTSEKPREKFSGTFQPPQLATWPVRAAILDSHFWNPLEIISLKQNQPTTNSKDSAGSIYITLCVTIANHYRNIPSLKRQMEKDCASDSSMKTRTHSQAPARKRNRKGSWGGLKIVVLARFNRTANVVFLIATERSRDTQK